jgi:hypothetical protein
MIDFVYSQANDTPDPRPAELNDPAASTRTIRGDHDEGRSHNVSTMATDLRQGDFGKAELCVQVRSQAGAWERGDVCKKKS